MAGEAKKPMVFGVYQKKQGSFGFGQYRFMPGSAVQIPEDLVNKVQTGEIPVSFFPDADKAAAELKRLKEVFAAKPAPQA